jgi:hypothetical protein
VRLIKQHEDVWGNRDFRHSHLTAVHNRDRSSAYTVRTQLPLAVMRDELTGHHIVPQPIRCSSLQRHFEASPRTY